MLDGVQKFNYLRAQLQGDAARVIAGLPLTSANYNNAMSLLIERFGQPHKIINAHMQALLDIANPVSSLSSLQLFYDTIEGHIRGLAALGKPEESYGALLIPIVLGKLPIETQRNLAREHGSLEWTLNDLKQGILKEIRVLESGLSINPTTRLSFDQTPMMTTASLHTGASANNSSKSHNSSAKRPCIFCKTIAHPPTKCDKIVDQQKCIDFIKEKISASIALAITKCHVAILNTDVKPVRENTILAYVILLLPQIMNQVKLRTLPHLQGMIQLRH